VKQLSGILCVAAADGFFVLAGKTLVTQPVFRRQQSSATMTVSRLDRIGFYAMSAFLFVAGMAMLIPPKRP
jgi:hypothetical protein